MVASNATIVWNGWRGGFMECSVDWFDGMVDGLMELLNRIIFVVGKLLVDRIFGGTGSIERNGRFKLLMERFN